jgi:histone H3/H4
MAETWLKCTECKKDIPFGGHHYVCSVSTCKRSKMRLVFCTPVCWDSHLSMVRHREAWAEDAVAPSKTEWEIQLADEAEAAVPPLAATRPTADRPPQVRPAPAPAVRPAPAPAPAVVSRPATHVGPAPAPPAPAPARRVVGEASPQVAAQLEGAVKLSEVTDRDILIVVSKMKKYIKDRSGFNCSDAVAEYLSDHVRLLCDDAIRAAARDERKTVLDRDVTRARR